ncbi:MAG: Ku protein [Deltaproteobacteria bacterium]|nr:Ku protein [Deltaproteobacteria bacterium]
MAARAIWKGVISFQSISIPVKFFSAVEDRKIHFRLLHDKDQVPVVQQMINPRTNEPVPKEKIRRGYVDDEEGTVIIIEDKELEALAPHADREVTVKGFLDAGHIGHQWYDRPYYLGPDGNIQDYAALAQVLETTGKEGFAQWTMRNKTYIGALRAEKGHLKMITLRFSGEVIEAAELPRPKGRTLEKEELKMAGQLVHALEGDFNPGDFHDEYRERVMELVRTKARGGKMRVEKPKKRKAEVISLSEMLKQSIRKAREERKVARAK